MTLPFSPVLASFCLAVSALPSPARAQLADPSPFALSQCPHALQSAMNAHTPLHPDHLTRPSVARGTTGRSCLSAKVFGFLPYWSATSTVRWDLLSHVACFSLEVNSAGNWSNIHGWPWTATITAAHSAGTKVLITVTSFDPASTLALLNSATARSNLTANLVTKLTAAPADGVVLDFEGSTANGWPALMPAFAAHLSSALKAVNPAWELYIATPAVNWGNAWNLPATAAASDGLFIMGYDFYGSWSATSGPSSPLTGGTYNITNTLNVQYFSVLQQDPKKLILGLPWYGNRWRTASSAAFAPVTAFVSNPTFAGAQSLVATYGRQWDSSSQTPWIRWQDASGWIQAWYDDPESLGKKMDFAALRRLAGVGMWALGYEGPSSALWDQIAARYAVACPCPADFTHDGFVDDLDFALFANWYDLFATTAGDLTGDGFTDDADFVIFAAAYDAFTCP